MNRRKFVGTGLFSTIALATVTNLADTATAKAATPPVAELDELTTADLQSGALMPHPPMPHVFLQPGSAKNLVAYLQSIQEQPRP